MNKGSKTWAMGAAAVALCSVGGYLAAETARAAPVNPPAAAPARPAQPRSFADLVERVAPAVVSIDIVGKMQPASLGDNFSQGGSGDDQDTPFGPDLRRFFRQFGQGEQAQPEPLRAAGSGFFISSDGYILTNNHVVEHADEITVTTKDDRKLKAKLVGRDPATDLAVIKVEGQHFPYVSFEDRAKPRVGDWVVAVGNPFGLGGTATAGIVSALGRKNIGDTSSGYVDFMQIDAPINRGNSGGPTFDVEGRVVGVNTAIFSPSGGSVGIGFDIPADVAASVSRQLIEHGKVVRGYIGAQIQDVTPEIADSIGLKQNKGALVAEVTDDGPAAKAGLKPGDVVLSVNGHEVDSASDLSRQVALVSPGQPIHLAIRRNGAAQTLTMVSGRRPSEDELASNDRGSGDLSGEGERVLGMRVEPASSGGLKIDGVRSGSDASEKGLRQGDVIRKAGDRTVSSVSDLTSAVDAAKKAGRKDVLLLIARNGAQLFVPLHVDQAQGQG